MAGCNPRLRRISSRIFSAKCLAQRSVMGCQFPSLSLAAKAAGPRKKDTSSFFDLSGYVMIEAPGAMLAYMIAFAELQRYLLKGNLLLCHKKITGRNRLAPCQTKPLLCFLVLDFQILRFYGFVVYPPPPSLLRPKAKQGVTVVFICWEGLGAG